MRPAHQQYYWCISFFAGIKTVKNDKRNKTKNNPYFFGITHGCLFFGGPD
jgi:hypothetical protein